MTAPTAAADSPALLRRLAVAAWGACWGILLATAATAALIAVNGDTQDRPHPSILPSEAMKTYVVIPWQERYERAWYVPACGAGALAGWAAARWVRPSPWLAAGASVAFLPCVRMACAAVFANEPATGLLLICAGILAVPLLWRTRADREAGPGTGAEPTPRRMWVTAGVLCLPLGGLLYGLLAPHDLATEASKCYAEAHVASYLVGPALYYRCPGVVPGLDFESHYGIGHAYAFSWFTRSGGFERTLQRYVVFIVVVTALYFVSGFLVLTDWLRNPWAAFAVTLGLVAVSFDGVSYLYPSNWPVRHPFAFVFLFALVRGVGRPGWCAAAGVVAGLSLFWQTDTGLYTLAAGMGLYVATAVFLGAGVWRPVVFLAAGAGTFAAVCLVLFGPRVLSPLFVERLLEPLLLYGTGFGNVLLNWHTGWGYWYNLAGPGLAVASVGLLLGYRRGSTPPRSVLYAAAAALLGLAMLFKWVNRSIDVLWSLNGSLVVAVAGWWAWVGWRAIAERLGSETRPWLGLCRRVAVAGVLAGLAVLGWREDKAAADPDYPGKSSSPLVRIAIRLDEHPNRINKLRNDLRPDVGLPPLHPDMVAYLRANTGKTERVAVISGADWAYLTAAGRAPRLYWVQLFLVHTPVLLDRCSADLRGSDRVFVFPDALITLQQVNPAAYARVAQILDEEFDPPGETVSNWNVYHRKPGPTAGK